MSKGYEAICIKEAEDEKTVMYKYACANINNGFEIYLESINTFDGIIIVDKSCFIKPKIIMETKRLKNGKKEIIEKKEPIFPSYVEYIKQELIKIENASHCWHKTEGIDFMVFGILFKMFLLYQQDEQIPDRILYSV